MKQLILQLYEKSNKQWGYRRVHMELQEEYRMQINHKRVFRLYKELGIQSIIRKKHRSSNYKQYKRTEPETITTNIINRDFSVDQPKGNPTNKIEHNIMMLTFSAKINFC
ncbi:IS3 family transposase [Cytobacillus sp. FSL R5-0596]|uniref:IS3 family transposase n=1 Tax=Cytobacillus sp. FSL R5-0596 TaxID=2954696 RepID=UPI0030F56CFC